MSNKFPSRRKAITIGVILAGLSAPVVAQDGDIEEVVVTGSYIRGSALDAPSPVTVVDRDSISSTRRISNLGRDQKPGGESRVRTLTSKEPMQALALRIQERLELTCGTWVATPRSP